MNTELLGKVGKCLFLLVLFSCFTFLFGLPALSTFLQAKVMTHTSVETFTEGAKRKALAPAITFCPRSKSRMKNKRSSGWKNTSAKDQHVLEYQCGTKEETTENILECIKNKTFDLTSQIIRNLLLILFEKLGNGTMIVYYSSKIIYCIIQIIKNIDFC